MISELRNYDLQTDVFLLVDLGYCTPIILLHRQVDKYKIHTVTTYSIRI